VAFVAGLQLLLYTIHTQLHLLPRWRREDEGSVLQLYAFNAVTVLLVICFVLCIVVHPGTPPDDDSRWELHNTSQLWSDEANSQECKRTSGERRMCKWCLKYKPDRCHHCRTCGLCILKMDHHCPWIYNCVGFRNQKYFYLLVMYAAIACNLIVWTMHRSVAAALHPSVPFHEMYLLVFGQTLAAFLAVASTAFLSFHTYLMLKATTTIEFCEKSREQGLDYNYGVVANIQAVLGDNVLLWVLPVAPASGSGLSFKAARKQAAEWTPRADLHG